MKKKIFIIVFFIFELSQKSFAYSSDPKQFIQEVVDEAKRVLVETNTKEFKTKKLSEMALKTVDIKGIAYYTIGNYRKEFNDEQMKYTETLIGARQEPLSFIVSAENDKKFVNIFKIY